MKKFIKNLIVAFILFGGVIYVSAAPVLRYDRTILPETDSTYELGTSTRAWLRINSDEVCLTADTCRTTWPAGGAGSSLHVDGGAFVYPTGGKYHSAPHYVATSSTASVFPYASTTALTISGNSYLGTVSSGTWNGSVIGDAYITKTGAWTGTFDGLEGSAYLARANHTGTQLASTISDFNSTARGLFSSTFTGLTYTSATGVFSATAGYNIPLTASTTNWNGFYDTPSTRITAGANCSWSVNTFNCTSSGGGGLGWASSTSPNTNSIYSTASENVGIGTTTPTDKLTVNGTLGSITPANDARVYFTSSIGAYGSMSASNAAGTINIPLVLQQYGSTVGIATTTPWKTFSVTGDMVLTGGFFDSLASAGTNGMVLQSTGSATKWVATSTLGLSGGSGTVTSVDMTLPTGLSVSGNPITTSGTLAVSLTGGYVIPLTASTTEWSAAYASTTALSNSYIRGLFSNTSTGLTYNNSTGATSLTAGYNIPLTASTTNWNNFYNTPSTRITDGAGLTWSSNTLNCDTASGSVFGCLSAADWTTFNGKLNTSFSNVSGTLGVANGGTGATTFGQGWLHSAGGTNVITSSTSPTVNYVTATSSATSTLPHLTGSFISGYGLTSCTGTSNKVTWSAGTFRCETDQAGSGSQTPWTANIDGAGFNLSNAGTITGTVINATSTTATSTLQATSITGAVSLLGEYFTNFTTYVRSLFTAGTGLTYSAGQYAINLAANLAWTGAHDFGGATSLEVPNGAAPTIDTAGEIGLDTTDNQLIVADSGNAAYVASRKVNRLISFALGSTSPTFVSGGAKQLPVELDGYTVTALRCNVEGGTSKVITLFGETLTCATTVTSDDGAIRDNTMTAGTATSTSFGATTGAVNYVNISIFGVWTRE